MVTIALAGGGTAGHTSPLIATADALRAEDPAANVFAIGTLRGLEGRVVPAAGIDLELIPPVPMPRSLSVDLALVGPRLAQAVVKARELLVRRGADVVVGFGGYVSTPVYLAAKTLRLPIVAHEQNAVPGLANKVAARLSDEVFTTFPGTPLAGATCIGLPVRPAIVELDRAARRSAAREKFDLDPDRTTLLVSGGSQGARSINEAVREAFPALLADGIQILHVLGQKNFTADMMSVTDDDSGARYVPVAYVEAMEDAYAAADLMLARSGAGTVVETAIVGLPTILVPLPHGNGEQARNAESVVLAGGARLLADDALNATWLESEVPALIGDADELARMSRAAQDIMPADAAQVLAARVLALAAGRG